MEYSLKLHSDNNLFTELITLSASHLNINPEFIEKDYWITTVLRRLAASKYTEDAVFKGGTSLSKAYNLIDRFSEDVDIAIINDISKSANEIKTIIRTLEKELTFDLEEIQMATVTSKGSRFRKSVFEYVTSDKGNANNKLIVEINSFANPFPNQKLPIKSMVYDFLIKSGNEGYINAYNLQPFEVNVLAKEQTLLEKLVSLIRCSFEDNYVESISSKIRHFYDLYFLTNHPECAEFVASPAFKAQFDTLLDHDRQMFDHPIGWQSKSINESPLVENFPAIWNQIKQKYQSELSALAYRPIPSEQEVSQRFSELVVTIS